MWAVERGLGFGLSSENSGNGFGFWIIEADQMVIIICDYNSSLSVHAEMFRAIEARLQSRAVPLAPFASTRQGVNFTIGMDYA
jgi:hypothetical protein